MRSMLQLLGGVAVAGAVAAGATAFTASGVTVDAGVTNPELFLGGGVQITATGTVIDGVTYDYANAGKTQLDEIKLHFADANSDTAKVTLVTAGTGSQPTWTCTDVATNESTCTATAFDLTANKINTMTVTVAPA